MNVLFLVVDDLRPELLAAYGIKNVNVSTPYLDEFSTKALTFRRAYVQQAVVSDHRERRRRRIKLAPAPLASEYPKLSHAAASPRHP